MNKPLRTLLMSVLIGTVLMACARPSSSNDPTAENQTITVKGSDTMVLLGQRWAEIYMQSHPNTTVQVTGGGSGTGIAALINGTTQICQSSRPMREEEKASLKMQHNADAKEIPVALDALAVFVHESNPIQSLTLEQLAKIYLGEITDWSQVGGTAGGIVMYGRENSSGTYAYFKEHVLANKDFPANYQALPGTAAVINAVVQDAKGIGYGGIGYSSGVKTVPVAKDANSMAVAPTEENVDNNTYPISRFLYFYTIGEPTGSVKEFVDWVLAPEGQQVVSTVGYYALRD